MASVDDVDDVITEDSALNSDLNSGVYDYTSELEPVRIKFMTSKTEVLKPSVKRQRKPTAKFLESCSNSDVMKDCKPKVVKKVAACLSTTFSTAQQADNIRITTSTSKKDRLLMKDWLVMIADNKEIKNVQWYDNEHTMLRIPWKHGSRTGWTQEDGRLYSTWAKYTGKYSAADDDEPKRWKANFRCALNSLPDVEEIKQLSQSRGTDPYKVYKLYPAKSRKGPTKKPRKPRRSRVVERNSPKQQQQTSKVPPTVNTNTSKSKVFVDNVAPTSHQMSVPTQQTTKQSAVPVLPLSVAPLQISMSIGQTRPLKISAADTSQDISSLRTRPYSAVIPTTVEEMSCDDDSDVDYSDLDQSVENSSAVDSLLESFSSTSSPPYDQHVRPIRSNRSTISESSSGYSTDPVRSPSVDPQLELESFDLTAWFDSDDNSVLPQFDACPEISAEETHGYALDLQSVVSLQSTPVSAFFFPASSYLCLPTNGTV